MISDAPISEAKCGGTDDVSGNGSGSSSNKEATGVAVLKSVLSEIMLRRTKHTKCSEGRPIVSLPSRDVFIEWVEMNQAEREFYAALMERSRYVSIGQLAFKNTIIYIVSS